MAEKPNFGNPMICGVQTATFSYNSVIKSEEFCSPLIVKFTHTKLVTRIVFVVFFFFLKITRTLPEAFWGIMYRMVMNPDTADTHNTIITL